MTITAQQLSLITGGKVSRLNAWIDPINRAMAEFGITTPARVCAFIAQVAHESGGFQYVREIWSPAQCPWQAKYDSRADLGNTKPEAIAIAARHGSTPGPWWKGHGLIELTGYDNHLECGVALNLDLLNNPDQLEVPINAARSAAWFWTSHGCNALADANNFRAITRVINGGYNGYDKRLALYERATQVLKYLQGPEKQP